MGLQTNPFARATIRHYYRRWWQRAWRATLAFERRWGLWTVNLGFAAIAVFVTSQVVDEADVWQYLLALLLGAAVSFLLVIVGAVVIAPALLDYEVRHGSRGINAIVYGKSQGLLVLSFSLPRRGDFEVWVDVDEPTRRLIRLRFLATGEVVTLRDFPVTVDLGHRRCIVIKQAYDRKMVVESVGARQPGLIEAEMYYEERQDP